MGGPGDVRAVPYVGPSEHLRREGDEVDDDSTLSAVDLLDINREIQGSPPTIRLLATLNLRIRHSDGTPPQRRRDQRDRVGGAT